MTDAISTEAATSATRQPTSDSSDTGDNQRDSHCVIAKCRRNTDVTTNATLNAQHESTEESDAEERLLVVYCRSGKLGAAYYTLQTGELFVLEEIVDRPPEYQMFSSLFRQVEPAAALLGGGGQGAFAHLVRRTVLQGRCKLLFLSAREYSFEACKRRIYSLSLPNEPPNCTEEERTLFLRTVVDFSQTQSVHALGALLRYLDLHWTSLSVGLQAKPQFLNLRTINLDDIVTMDADSYRGLQIFNTVSHPSNFKRGALGSSREGLSLFQLFSKCSSQVGQNRMRVLMQHPTRDLVILKRRQDAVAFFMRPQNDSIMRNLCSSLRFIKNVNGIMTKIKALSAKAYQWKSLYNTLYNALLICEMCESAGKSSEFLEQLASTDNTKLYEMALYMNRIIDFDLSKSEGKFTVKAGVDPELDMKKQTMASLQGLMSETAKVELERLPSFIEECTMLYMPHLGYLLGVKAWADNLTMEQKELPDMKFMFQNNDYIHYKTKGCEELDVVIGDTYPEIAAHETRLMLRLARALLQHLHALDALIHACAELDCLISIAKVCKEYGYVRPTLTEDKVISIKQGKHPLHMISCEAFVPNDAESGGGSGAACVTLLTGPNSSGKSVYMKQIVLIVYLAHIGSFVPAEAATIGVLRRIHTRIHSAECVAAHMSAFLIDLKQMSAALRECGECGECGEGGEGGALVAADEFGRGAGPDGLPLLAAWLAAWLQRARPPHLLVATHFHNLTQYMLHSPMVKFLKLEHIVRDGEPVFLYRVGAGSAGSAAGSLARRVAAAGGLPARVVARADTLLHCVTNNTLPPENEKILSKLRRTIEIITNELLTDDI